MEKQLSKFFQIVGNPYDYLANWKEATKRKVIGVYPMHIPEEIIHATGMLPVVMWRGSEPITLGDAHIASFNCAISRSFTDDLVKGKLSFLDGIVIHMACLQTRGIAYIIEANSSLPYFQRLYFPAIIINPAAKEFLLYTFKKLKAGLEKFSGQTITTESLENSIRIYNKNRALLKRVYELRRRKPGALKAKEASAIVQSSMLMPKEEHSQLLQELLPELEKRKTPEDEKRRLVLVGCLCQTPHAEVLDLIEDAGAHIVDDDIYVGSQYFATDVELNKDPLECLADQYLRRTPMSLIKSDWESNWCDQIVRLAKSNRADGVIFFMMRYCPPLMMYVPDLRDESRRAGIPMLLLEIEHDIPSMEKLGTQVTAFIESLKGG